MIATPSGLRISRASGEEVERNSCFLFFLEGFRRGSLGAGKIVLGN